MCSVRRHARAGDMRTPMEYGWRRSCGCARTVPALGNRPCAGFYRRRKCDRAAKRRWVRGLAARGKGRSLLS